MKERWEGMNILLCSAGRRVKLVRYFKGELKKMGGQVIAVDCNPTASALHFADHFEIVPRIHESNYIEEMMRICQKYHIRGILSLIDPELSLLAEYKSLFAKENIQVIVSEPDAVNTCFDKYAFIQHLRKHQLPVVPTYLNNDSIYEYLQSDELRFPLFVKPRNGSASIGIRKITSMEELQCYINGANDLIIQPFISGDEFGVDCYVDLVSKKVTNIFCKKKIKMRAGETDKSVAIKDSQLLELIEKLTQVLSLQGPIDVDCFLTEEGYVISEINPRFGGGYPHAHEAGQNFVKNIMNNLLGRENEVRKGDYQEGSVMIKYDDVLIIPAHENLSSENSFIMTEVK